MSLDIFSEQSGGGGGGSSEVKTLRIVQTFSPGILQDPITTINFGSISAPGKNIGLIRMRVLTQSLTPNFQGGSAGTANAVIVLYATDLTTVPTYFPFIYNDAGSGDPLTTDGWQIPQAPQDDTINTGVDTIQFILVCDNPGGAWDLTGQIQIIVEYIEN